MPNRPAPRRPHTINLKPWQLIASIALGIWLGGLALLISAWLLATMVWPHPLAVMARHLEPAPVATPKTAEPSNPMFEQYQENLHKQQQQQNLEQARSNPRNLSNPQCQFWLQQDQTAPSDKSRANVLQLCD